MSRASNILISIVLVVIVATLAWWLFAKQIFSSTPVAISTEAVNKNSSARQAVLDFFKQPDFNDLKLVPVASKLPVASSIASLNGLPPAPFNFIVNDRHTGEALQLSWELPEDNSRTAVEVWRGDTAVSLSLLSTLLPEANTFVDTGLKRDQTYWYKVGVRASEALAFAGEALPGRPVDTTPPLPPKTIELQRVSQGSGFIIAWQPADINELVTYSIYRAEKAEELGIMLAQTINTLSFEDKTTVPGHRYWYRVVAVDAADNRSLPTLTNAMVGRAQLLGTPTATVTPAF